MSVTREIAAKVANQTAPRVTEASIKDHIEKVDYIVRDVLTICIITMVNGFTVIGESACDSLANYDKAVGEHFAFEAAFKKLWPLEGYLLKQRLYDDAQRAEQVALVAKPTPEEALTAARARVSDDSHLREEPPALYGSSVLPAVVHIGGYDVQLGGIVCAAQARSQLSAYDWNALSEVEREQKLADLIARLQANPRNVTSVIAAPSVVVRADPIELFRIDSHPVARAFYDLMIEVEKFPADTRQTAVCAKVDEARRALQALLNDPDYLAKVKR